MILGKQYIGPEVDIWSSGVVLYVLCSGKFPFSGISELIKGSYITPDYFSAELSDLIHLILVVELEKRISLNDLRNHPWMTQLTKP